jgi:hypothetical protein
MSTGSLLDKKPGTVCHVLTKEKLDKTEAILEHTPQKSLRRLAQETSISNSPSSTGTKLFKVRP